MAGNTYSGLWENGSRVMGVGRNFKGESYLGEFQNDRVEGLGCYKFQHGDEYIGSFLYGRRNGVGVTRRTNNPAKIRCIASFENDRLKGYGINYWRI
jgi:hypothetical protein